jgi:hypothetical protein
MSLDSDNGKKVSLYHFDLLDEGNYQMANLDGLEAGGAGVRGT